MSRGTLIENRFGYTAQSVVHLRRENQVNNRKVEPGDVPVKEQVELVYMTTVNNLRLTVFFLQEQHKSSTL